MKVKRCHRCSHPRSGHKRGSMCAWGWRLTTEDETGLPFWYGVDEPGSECSCPAYVDPPRELVRRGRQSVKRGAKGEELARRAGPGRADLVSDEEAIEVKVMPKNVRSHIAQAQRLRGYRGAVVRYVEFNQKGIIWELRRLG